MEINKDNLLITLVKNGNDFIDYGPIGLVEKLFERQEDNIGFVKLLNNFDATVKQAIEKKLYPLFSKLDPDTFIFGDNMLKNGKRMHSKMYAKQTIKNFWDSIDQAIETCWIDKEELKKMYGKEVNRWEEWEKRERIYRKIWPVYIQLRKEGYTSFDLTC